MFPSPIIFYSWNILYHLFLFHFHIQDMKIYTPYVCQQNELHQFPIPSCFNYFLTLWTSIKNIQAFCQNNSTTTTHGFFHLISYGSNSCHRSLLVFESCLLFPGRYLQYHSKLYNIVYLQIPL
jgi:hypothetical protein